ncbi:hypothetical protein JNW90_33865 [Micromonospora sp. STR1s_5]|nr:hypothetical protein [Micromonospora sp. STR1s_5]
MTSASKIEPKTQETIDFLIRYRGSDPIVLTCITPDGAAPVESETFKPAEDTERLRAWLDARQGIKNLYFHVNPTMRPMSGRVKARKEHIRGMTTLHVDLDPRKGEDLEKERERAQRLISSYSPPPSFLIDSGGGFQGFWLLDQEYEIQGNEDKALELEAYNQQIAIVLAADPCQNADRIMRLPGTVNVPDAKRRARGRKPAPTRLVYYDDTRVYTLADFTPAPGVQSKGPRTGGAVVKLSGNLPKADLTSLPDKVTQSTRDIILQGEDPSDLTRFPSRSEPLFFVCCELVRAEVDDDTIASIILDPDLAISASVLDKPRPNEYAARQIQRAKEHVESPELRELNDLHAVIRDYGGRCRVITEAPDCAVSAHRPISAQSFEDFRNGYLNRSVQVSAKKFEALGNWWLKHPKRRQYSRVEFAPRQDLPGDVFNLWKGFACAPHQGDCSLFLQHVFENICAGDVEINKYLLDWMARTVQNPGTPGEVAIVLRGKQGTGKSKFANIFGSLWGRHYTAVSDPKHFTGSFNAHLRDCVVLFADEAFYAGDRKHESVLKQIITEDVVIVERKGYDAEQCRNCKHLILASNSPWVVPAGLEERRFIVLDVGDKQMQNSVFFAEMDHQMNNGGREALLQFLLSRDISGLNVRIYPQTEALREQKLLSLEPHQELWIEALKDGVTPDSDFWKPGPDYVSVRGMLEVLDRVRALPPNRRALESRIGLFLKQYAARGLDGKVIERKVRRRVVMVGGRYVEWHELEDEGGRPDLGVEDVRRTMIQLRPLQALRAECAALVEGWPASPSRWIMDATT